MEPGASATNTGRGGYQQLFGRIRLKIGIDPRLCETSTPWHRRRFGPISTGVQNPDLHALPEPFRAWFAQRGWQPHPHQLELLQKARQGRSSLLIAPTGGGKTLAGFLPSLLQLSAQSRAKGAGRRLRGDLHTLYLSPLKALAADIRRTWNGRLPNMELPISVELRTGDTPLSARTRQRQRPPDILLSTPEQLAPPARLSRRPVPVREAQARHSG